MEKFTFMNKNKKVSRAAFVSLMLFHLAATPSDLPTQPSNAAAIDQAQSTLDAAYKIAPQNLIQIRILGEDGLQQTFRVDDNGYITHPLVGRVKVAGQTVSNAEEMLEKTLKDDYIRNPHITIFVVEHSHFSMLGEVREPGNYEILGKVSMMQAISMAGGFTPVANERKVRVLRRSKDGAEQSLEVDVQAIMDGAKEDNEFVQAGDVINVPKSFF
jgi:polysaccharide biosynthesis/export protein